jgi:tRNA (guanine-N(7)-)-methyltransferase subunit TRM82
LQTLNLSGNALAVVVGASTTKDQSESPNRLLVSVDTVHKPGSTTEIREHADKSLNPLQSYIFQEGQLVQDGTFQLALADQGDGEGRRSGVPGQLINLLYNLENLRKREGEGQEE